MMFSSNPYQPACKVASAYSCVAIFLYLFLAGISAQAQTSPYYPSGVKNPRNQTNVNGIWYYTADYYRCDNYYEDGGYCLDWFSGYELWRSNGTASGTVRLKVYATYGSPEYGQISFASAFLSFNNYLYFINGADTENISLCRINNTSTEPTVIKSFFVSDYRYYTQRMYQSAADYHLTAVNGNLYFTLDEDGYSPVYGTELWKSNGTTTETVMVKDIRPGGESSQPADLRNENGMLYFTADDGSGRKLWKTDGTAAGTVRLDTESIALPSPWQNKDIGSVVLPGSARYSRGLFTLESSGYDFFRAPDSFHYVYQPFNGNATLITKVESIGNTHPYALAGIMIRENLSASSSFVAAVVNPSHTNFMYRQGAGTPGYKQLSGSAPRWLKLERSDNKFTSFYSSDGQTWMPIGSITITMGSSVYVGLALTSQSTTQLNRAVFSYVSISPTLVSTACIASGTILREYWANVSGKTVAEIPVNSSPTFTSQLTSFEAPTNLGDNYGQRIRGYICAPASGNYTFYIASDDNSELWLSTDANPANKRKIASVTGYTSPKQWTKFSSQKSVVIALLAGKKYYIEALHKEGAGGDNLSVGWQIPSDYAITLIPGAVLSPYVPATPACTASGTILREYWANISGGTVANIPVNTPPTSSIQLTAFETPSGSGDNYGQRIRGYICAPATGNYTFYLASDDQGELWLSSNESPANKQKIAYLTAHTSSRQWTKYASQKSASITLEKGKKYYIEALHKEAIYGDNLAVGWTVPGSTSISVIPGSVLSPFVPSAARLARDEEVEESPLVVYPNPFSDKLSLATNGQQGKVVVTLTDVVGKRYFLKEYYLSGQVEIDLDFSALPLKAGLHLLKLQTKEGKIRVIKVLKK